MATVALSAFTSSSHQTDYRLKFIEKVENGEQWKLGASGSEGVAIIRYSQKSKQTKFINDLNADMYEPNGWKIILNNTSEKFFYMSKTWDSKIDYIQLPKDTNTFVINEQTYPHGSTFVKDKCVISIFGLVDKDKANKLIDESKKKYSNYIIEY